MNSSVLVLAILGTLFVALVGIGVHQAINRLLGIVDGHLERVQGKLDVLLAAQVEHNEKMDLLLRKLL
ncbi:MAG: hypothetical protein KAJ55_17495 [Anaerolineales bacterium]|nr:hypothetical protein [Anaerolineales bacterium]